MSTTLVDVRSRAGVLGWLLRGAVLLGHEHIVQIILSFGVFSVAVFFQPHMPGPQGVQRRSLGFPVAIQRGL